MNLSDRFARQLEIFASWRRTVGRGSAVFGIVVGLLVGVLVAALVVPSGSDDAETIGGVGSGQGDSGFGAGESVDDGGTSEGGAVDAPVEGGGPAQPAGGGGGSSTAGGVSGGTQAGDAPSERARGVTDDAIKIGVALLDLGAVRQLGPAFDNGDRRRHFESILEGWRRRGLLPVNGRDVRFVYRSYGVLSLEEQRAACVGLVQDEQVFAVVADSRFHLSGAECVAREFRTPLILHDGPADPVFARGHPFLFSVQMSEDRLLRNLIHWAHGRGVLTGKKIGIYYEDQQQIRAQMDRTVKAELKRLGHELAAEVSTAQTLGGPRDAVAVQQFQGNGVQVAMLFTSKAGFMQQAQAQRYRPTYLESDYSSGTTNTATSTYPAEHFDGTFGMSGLRVGEWKSNMAAPPPAEECVSDYQRTSGNRIEPNAREAEYIAMNKACDAARVLLYALRALGRDVTPARLVGAVESLSEIPMGIAPPVTFGPDRHHGVTRQRTVQWSAGCQCWRAQGQFAPLLVP